MNISVVICEESMIFPFYVHIIIKKAHMHYIRGTYFDAIKPTISKKYTYIGTYTPQYCLLHVTYILYNSTLRFCDVLFRSECCVIPAEPCCFRYIISIENEDEIVEYVEDLLQGTEGKKKEFIEDLVQRWQSCRSPAPYVSGLKPRKDEAMGKYMC